MIDRDVTLEALSTLCNANVTSAKVVFAGAASLSIKTLISTLLESEETCQVSRSSYDYLQTVLQGFKQAAPNNHVNISYVLSRRSHSISNDEFFDPRFDYDFTNLRDTETYYRGGEVYERPCGWQRFALKDPCSTLLNILQFLQTLVRDPNEKCVTVIQSGGAFVLGGSVFQHQLRQAVLDKYDGNTWLGNRYRSTESVSGEWPVSYHGTSKAGAEGIIAGFYKPGSGDKYGSGIYSTPYIAEAIPYAKTFTSRKTGRTYRVLLQNRINPKYRQKHRDNGDYWLVFIPKGTPAKEEQKMVERAIRPYGLLLKDISNPEEPCSIL